MRSTVMLAAERFEDPENARVILLSAAGLVLVAVLVAAGTFWWWRTSRVEHPALGPLEVMGSRSFTKGDYTSRRRRLEAARPAGAEPADATVAPVVEPVDLRAAAAGVPPQFDDLADVSVADVGAGARPHADLAALVAAVSSGAAVAPVPASDEVPVAAAPLPSDAPLAAADASADGDADGADGDGAGGDGTDGDGADGVEGDVEPDGSDAGADDAPREAVADTAAPVEEEADPTSVSAEVPRPIDPLLRLQSE